MSSVVRRALARAYRLGSSLSDEWLTNLRQWLISPTVDLDPQCRIHRTARLEPLGGDRSSIRVGAFTQVRGELLVAAHGGRIAIGEWCYVGEGTRLWSAAEIVVENRVLIAHSCDVHDWNAHPIDARERHEQFRQIIEAGHPRSGGTVEAAPIRIKEDAWIGFGATVLKGVTVGARSVVASRSLVLEDVPDDTLVGGTPARPLRKL